MSNARVVSADSRFLNLDVFPLEGGAVLSQVVVAHRCWGRLAGDGGNAVLVCHALTGSADVDAWWGGLLGPGRALDPRRDFVVCANVLGSCYGTTGPASTNPVTGAAYGPDFPPVTVRDMVRLQRLLLDHLGVCRLRLVIGGSLGGMQALEWAATFPEMVDAIAAVATSGRHSAWCVGFSEAQRRAIAADPRWRGGHYAADEPPADGLAIARMIAMCTYRSPASFGARFGRESQGDAFAVERYLRRHGEKLVARFDANCYVTLSRAMDSHDLARGRGDYVEVLGRIAVPALVVGIASDVLYPPSEQEELAGRMPCAELAVLGSLHGHDAFLIEQEALGALVTSFRRRLAAAPRRAAV